MKIKKILTNQYLYSIMIKIVLVVIGFINSMLIARYFGPNIKGITATILNYSNVIAIIITFGIHEAYPFYRKKTDDKEFISKYMSNVIGIYTVYLFISCIIAVICRQNIKIIMILGITLFHGYSMVVNYVALVEKPNRRNSIIMILNLIDIIILIGLYLFVPVNLLIACLVSMFIYVAESIYFTFFVKFEFKINFIKIRFIMQLIKFGLFPMIALLLTTLNYRVDILMLSRYATITYADIGVYSLGVSLAEKVFLVPDAVKEILLSKLVKGKNEDEVAKVIRICWPICFIATLGILIVGKTFISFFYGVEYLGAYIVTVVSVFGTIFMVFFKMISTYNIVHGKQRLSVMILSISVLINIIMNMILIPRMNILGAALASDIAYFSCALMFVFTFCKSQNYSLVKLIFMSKDDFLLFYDNFLKKGK